MPTKTHRRLRSDLPVVLHGLGVLLVLLGVVAMHQLAGGNHMATMAAAPAATSAASTPGAPKVPSGAMPSVLGTGTPTQDAHGSGPNAGARMPGEIATAAATRSAAGHDSMPICLAVLPGFQLLAPPSAPGAAGGTPADAAQVIRHRTSPPGRAPPGALLAQLCVLRT